MTSIVSNEGVSSDTGRPRGPLWSDIEAPQENNRQKKTEPEMEVITSVLTEQQERKKRNKISIGRDKFESARRFREKVGNVAPSLIRPKKVPTESK